MKISYNWLKDFVELKKMPVPKLADLLTMNFAEVDGVEEVIGDDILDLKILPDRASDCLSHYGVAREIATLAKLKVKSLKFEIKENRKEKIENILEIDNQEPKLCRRYISRVIQNVNIGPSPKWLSQRLESIGQKSINNVVDATNYVMFELGQPLHVFDLNKVENVQVQSLKSKVESKIQNLEQIPKIIIRKAHNGEKIATLDGQQIELNEDILVIADGKGALAIAGVKGGQKAEVDENTKNIILESANFDAGVIRKSSRLTGIRTESSIRFAADLDPNLAEIAMERLASLIAEIARGDVAYGKVDIYPRKSISPKVAISVPDVHSLLGQKIAEKEILNILKRLDFKVQKISQEKELLMLAKKFIGRPYKYGASTSQDAPRQFDCSSFVQYLYWQIGIEIPRISVEQFLFTNPIRKEDLKIGDLLFSKGGKPYFYKETSKGIGHVGIYVGNNKVIHASGKKQKVVLEDISVFTKKDFRGFGRVGDLQSEVFVAQIPTYRRDIRMKADLIEEIGRIYGYQNLLSKLPSGILVPPKRNDELHFEFMAKNAMLAAGFSEAFNYAFIGERDLQIAGLSAQTGSDKDDILSLKNYLSDERKYLRPNLVFGLLKNVKDNFKNFEEVRIFEVGRVYFGITKGIQEKKYLGGVVAKKGKSTGKEFYEIKGVVDLLMGKLGVQDFWYDDFKPVIEKTEEKLWHVFKTAEIKVGDDKIGIVGEINPKIIDAYEINGNVSVFEIDFEKLAKIASEEYIYRPISKFPPVIRDLAVLTPIDIKVDTVLNIVENIGGKLLLDTDLFDIYEGDNIAQGMKSMAFHLIFQSQDRTLSDREVDEIVNKIVIALSGQGWEIRG